MGCVARGVVFYGIPLPIEEVESVRDRLGGDDEESVDNWFYLQFADKLDAVGCELTRAGHWDCEPAMLMLCIANTEVRAEWDECKELSWAAPKDARWKLAKACEILGVPYREPGWWVTSMYW